MLPIESDDPAMETALAVLDGNVSLLDGFALGGYDDMGARSSRSSAAWRGDHSGVGARCHRDSASSRIAGGLGEHLVWWRIVRDAGGRLSRRCRIRL